MSKYEYLKQFVLEGKPDRYKKYSNVFTKVVMKDIVAAEKILGFEFPKALKEFWLEIGSGILDTDVNGVAGCNNLIFSPLTILDTILRIEEESAILLHVLDDYLQEDHIPFFEIGDSSSYLIMKKGSNSVYDMDGSLLEESFERFIWRLYHESAKYYLFVGQHALPKPE